MTFSHQSRQWTRFLCIAIVAALTGVISGSASGVSASTEKIAIYFAVCDGATDDDTVKIKKIYEDGTGLTTIGDTTIAMCSQGPEVYFSGLASTSEFSYFSWYRMNGSAAGIGRLKNDGSTPLELNYMTMPASPLLGWFQMSPRVLDGHVYVNVRNVATPSQHRIVRGSLLTGEMEVCHQPSDLGVSGELSIGVGRDAVYFAAYTSSAADSSGKIYKTDCTTTTLASNFSIASGEAMFHRALVGPFDYDNDGNSVNNPNINTSTLIAESDTTSYVYTIKSQVGDKDVVGLSTMSALDLSGFVGHGAVIGGSNFEDFTDSQVWGFNYLYYKDGAASKMFRVAPGGTPEQVFAEHINGVLHHMSVVKETPAAPAAPTTPTPDTKAPLLISKKGVTGKQIARDLGLKITKGSKIRLSVAKKSRKVCAVKKDRVVATQAAKNCRVTINITPKKGKAIKRTTSFKTL